MSRRNFLKGKETMTYITQLTSRKTMSILQIMTMILAGFVLVVLQSSTVHAQWATSGNNINNTNTGNVGIGTTSPSLPLDVRGNSIIIGSGAEARALIGNYDMTPMAQGVGGGVQFGGKFHSNGTTAGFASISGIKENATDNDFSSALVFTTRANPNAQTERMRISGTGNVGIGTTSPGAKLHVNAGGTSALLLGADTEFPTYNVVSLNGSVTDAGHLGLAGGGGADKTLYVDTPTGGAINFRVNVSSKVIIDTSGKVGIGTATPTYSLDVNGGTNGFRAKAATVSGNDTIATFENATGIQAIVRANGNVGIGTTSPSKKLDVVGDINATGTITGGNIVAKYQDVAEWVQSSQELPAGTVVVLDQTKSNQVIASSQAYDTRVAGVISLQPGITLGENGAGKVLVATTGRVRIKVDASQGSIQVGDLLVTSDVTGLAMKSQPIDVGGVQIHRPGTLIGKALEPLDQGVGEILVLLSLQ